MKLSERRETETVSVVEDQDLSGNLSLSSSRLANQDKVLQRRRNL